MNPSLRSRFVERLGAEATRQNWRALVAEHGTPLLILDPAKVTRQCELFARHLPGVQIRYAVKAAPHPAVLDAVAAAGGGFDVATSAEVDLRVGGEWRYVMNATGGHEVAFHGEFREIVPEERIVNTEVYEGAPDEEALDTVTFAGDGDRTTLTILMQLSGRETRDAILATGMEDGMQEGMDLLEEVATSLR